MSSRRRTRAARITEDELNALVLKLQAILPASSTSRCTTRVPASKILEETYNYIKKLHREVEDLGGRLSHLLDSVDSNRADVEILRSLLQE